jgi:hypothetical protein
VGRTEEVVEAAEEATAGEAKAEVEEDEEVASGRREGEVTG